MKWLFKKKSAPKLLIYTSIDDLPIWNWNKIYEKNDYSFLKIGRKDSQITKSEFSELKKAWEKIFSEYIERFGFSYDFIAIHEQKKMIALLQLEFIETGDRSKITFIELAQKELSMMTGGETKVDFWKSKSILEKYLGFQIDVKNTSVAEFYSYYELIKEERKSA